MCRDLGGVRRCATWSLARRRIIVGMARESAATAVAPRAQIDRRIDGRFVVDGTLGEGGMGAVYAVHDEATGRRVALKQMAAGHDEGFEAARLRFRREFHTMATLKHPRIVEVFDYGVADGTPYYTLELLDGQDLHDLDRLPVGRACEVLRDVASALAFLHARRLLHRDLATRNVRCTSDGRAKLIDFGVLATTGISGDVAGTPPYMAPETVYGRSVDHRADLYGLGALAYRIVAGRHAFPARNVDHLAAMWRDRPPPPSALAADVPPALDELIASLLAADPLARPSGATEVIDRLTTIGGLDRVPEIEVAHGWIASAALVGRKRETSQIRKALGRAAEGGGRSILIEAPSGTGKSRMLRELGLEAQLAGACVVRADSDAAGRGPYGVVHALARGLLAAAPADAEDAARSRAGMLARVVTSLGERLAVEPATPAGDPAEDRMRLVGELAAWFLDVAARRVLVLVVDDVQRCDEASAAVLATLAHEAPRHKLIVATALRTDEAVRAGPAIAAMTDAGQRIRLRGLDEAQLGELCRSLFGAAPHIPRLARWMHKVAGGSPLHSLELARHLVDRGTIRYADGLWVIPEELANDDLPRGLADAMDARVASLPPGARALGEALSVHGGALPLASIVELADTREPEAVFDALDRLGYEEILMQAGDRWQFRHDGPREAFLRGLDAARRTELHRRVGLALASQTGDGPGRHAEIGWHLLRGGETERGISLLERAGRALYEAQSFSDCIAPLEAVLEVLDQRARPTKRRLEILNMLLMAGCMADRKVALRHAQVCVDAYRRAAGVDVATRLSRFVGRYLGVTLGITWALVRWLGGLGRGPNPYEAFRTFFIVTGYATTLHSLGFDLERAKAMVAMLEPVAILPNRVPYAVYLLTSNLYHFPRGDGGTTRRNARRILEILERDRITPIREIDRRTGGGGARYMVALLAVIDLEPDLEHELDELRALRLRFFEVGVDQARIIQHRMRGEEEVAAEIEARVELEFVRLGSVWQVEAFMPVISSLAYGNTRDMLGLRRTIEELAVMCNDGFRYDGFLALARGEYLRERGDAAAALVELEPVAARDDHPMLQTHALCALAETLIVTGDHARAKEVAAKGVAVSSDPETHNYHTKIRAHRALALAEAALGEPAAAAARLDGLLDDVTRRGSPMLTGGVHEARARIALAMGDTVAFHRHREGAEREFRATRNPVLIGRAERLAAAIDVARTPSDRADTQSEPITARSSPRPSSRAGRRAPGRERSVVGADAVTTPHPSDARAWVSSVLSGCRGNAERAAKALQLVISEARGASGYLFLRRGGELSLAAPTFGDEPPTALRRELSRLVHAAPSGEATQVERPAEHPGWLTVPLTLELRDDQFVIGVVAVFAGALDPVMPDRALLVELARELFEAGDATHTRTPK